MLKSYLEYSSLDTFGVICSFPANIVVNANGDAITGALEKVNIWNIREGKLIKSLYQTENTEQAKKKGPLVTRLCLSSDNALLAVGYVIGHSLL